MDKANPTSFQELRSLVNQFETHQNLTSESVSRALSIANTLKGHVAREAIFSSNESMDDLVSESIPLLLLPYYTATILIKGGSAGSQTMDFDKRKLDLEFSEANLEEFLSSLNNYGLLHEQVKKAWKKANPTQISRDDKIAAHKRKKEIQVHIEILEKRGDDEETKRELYIEQLRFASEQAVEDLKFVKLELEMLKMRSNPPPTQPAPRASEPVILKVTPENVCQVGHYITSTQDLISARDRIKQKVFQPGHILPAMTIEEYGEIEKKMMEDRMAMQAEAQAQAPKEDSDSDNEEAAERKRKKQSGWDDWKDENEKGAGNRMR